jgi:hypothetical protein
MLSSRRGIITIEVDSRDRAEQLLKATFGILVRGTKITPIVPLDCLSYSHRRNTLPVPLLPSCCAADSFLPCATGSRRDFPIRYPDEGRVIGRMSRIYVWRAPQKF